MPTESQVKNQALQNEWNSVEKTIWENLKKNNITSSFQDIATSNFSSDKLFESDIMTMDRNNTTYEIPRHGDMVVGIQFYDLYLDQFISLDIEFAGNSEIENAIQVKGDVCVNNVPILNDKYMLSLLNTFHHDIRLKVRHENVHFNPIRFSIIYGYLKTEMRRKVAQNSFVCRNVKNNDDLFFMKGMGFVSNKEDTFVTDHFANGNNLLIEQQGFNRCC